MPQQSAAVAENGFMPSPNPSRRDASFSPAIGGGVFQAFPRRAPRERPWPAIGRWIKRWRDSGSTARISASDRLDAARGDFVAALSDIGEGAAKDLQTRAKHARSLRELWHLRAELFGIVARRFSQLEAQHRVERLGVHFPARASESERRTV